MSKTRPSKRLARHQATAPYSTPSKITQEEGDVKRNSSFLVNQVGRLFLSKDLSDCTLLARTGKGKGSYKRFPAHRQILGACSDYWRGLLCGQFREAHQSEIKIEDVSADVLEEVLRFVYCGHVQLTADILVDVIMAAKQFQLDELRDYCLEQVRQQMTPEFCCTLLESTDDLDLDDLKAECRRYLGTSADMVFETPELAKKLSKETLLWLLKNSDMTVDEYVVFQGVCMWCEAHANDPNDKEELRALYEPFELLVRYPLIHPRELAEEVRLTGVVKESLLLDAWEHLHGINTSRQPQWMLPRSSHLRWRIPWDKFKTEEKYVDSHPIHINGNTFRMRIFPKGTDGTSTHLSLFVAINKDAATEKTWRTAAKFSISLVNQVNEAKTEKKNYEAKFKHDTLDWGHRQFVKLSDVVAENSGFIVNNTMVLDTFFEEVWVPADTPAESEAEDAEA
eukprot:comp39010_c0_seq1/m.47367 comp39010_c0_seq1/g.47367  ORF comp39010_c0_seq1/g.47367 comp39010_c0_seq1/m.47367 type:complete len:452 (-) comp39010_c0_seq1:35-1390(-)